MSPLYDVFLSHATADKPAVEYLAHKLQEAGITLFLDKWHLIPGEPWAEALEEAFNESQTCAVFLGPAGIGGWQNEEMRSALDERVRDKSLRVIPVLLPGSFEPRKEELPRFLHRLTWVDFRAGLDDEGELCRLVSGVRGTAPGPGGDGGGGGPIKPPRPYSYRSMAQAPEEFVFREEYNKVLEALCPKEGAVQSGTSVGITTALRGAGGFGKTALAQQLCQDPKVHETYPDGILWTTMGEEIDSNGRLNRILDLIRWWTQEEPPSFTEPAPAGAHLRDLLKESKALVVIDDVWSSADVTPFQGIGNSSALLITTRDSQTLPSGSKKIEVDAMASTEAVELLRFGLPDGEEREFVSLAARLGEWPLLLKIVNRYLRDLVSQDGFTTAEVLGKTRKALDKKGFSAFNLRNKEERHAAAGRTISVSIQRLSKEEAERYFQLAVFPEDADIPLPVLQSLWRIDIDEVEDFCRRLYELSLLLRFDLKSCAIRLHDVTREVLIEQIGNRLPDLHRVLLDNFRPASGSWSDLPMEENYLWNNLAGHLLESGRKDDLRRLLKDLSFLRAKLNAAGVNALMADYQTFVENENELRLIRDALRLSAHVLARDPEQLASQLFGRLAGIQQENIGHLIDAAKTQLWLRPRPGTLVPAGGPLIRTLEGHSGGVNALAVLDGRRAISGSEDGALRVWDLETGETLTTLQGHSGRIRAVVVVNGHRVISGFIDGTLRVWDLETGEPLTTLNGHSGRGRAVAVVDSHRAISGSKDGALRVWDLETGETLTTLKGHSSWVNIVVVDGRRAVSGSSDWTLRVWDLETGETLRILKGHLSRVNAVAMVDDHRAVSGSSDRTLRVWDLETGETLRILKGHSGRVNAVAVVDDHRAVSGSNDGTLRVWDLETGDTLKILKGHLGEVRAVAVVDNCRAVSGSDDQTLRVWDLETGETLTTLEKHSDRVNAVAVVDDRRAISGSNDQTLRVWDLETGETLTTLKGHFGKVRTIAVVDGHWAISGSNDLTLRVWDLETGKTLRTLKKYSGVSTAAVDGRQIVSSSNDGRIQLWNLETGKTLRTLKGRPGVSVVSVVDCRRGVSGFLDGVLRVWDLETGKTLRTLKGHLGKVRAVAVVDGRRAVSGSVDGTLQVWDLETGETLRTLEGHSHGVSAVSVVDGRRAVSGSNDRTLRVWDLETGETLAVVTLEAPVLAVAVSLDGRIVVAGDQAGRVHFLDWVEPPIPADVDY